MTDPGRGWAAREAVVAALDAPPPDWWERLTKITAPALVRAPPALVGAGGSASHLPQDRLTALTARIPAARRVTIDAGHAIPATRPADPRRRRPRPPAARRADRSTRRAGGPPRHDQPGRAGRGGAKGR